MGVLSRVAREPIDGLVTAVDGNGYVDKVAERRNQVRSMSRHGAAHLAHNTNFRLHHFLL